MGAIIIFSFDIWLDFMRTMSADNFSFHFCRSTPLLPKVKDIISFSVWYSYMLPLHIFSKLVFFFRFLFRDYRRYFRRAFTIAGWLKKPFSHFSYKYCNIMRPGHFQTCTIDVQLCAFQTYEALTPTVSFLNKYFFRLVSKI